MKENSLSALEHDYIIKIHEARFQAILAQDSLLCKFTPPTNNKCQAGIIFKNKQEPKKAIEVCHREHLAVLGTNSLRKEMLNRCLDGFLLLAFAYFEAFELQAYCILVEENYHDKSKKMIETFCRAPGHNARILLWGKVDISFIDDKDGLFYDLRNAVSHGNMVEKIKELKGDILKEMPEAPPYAYRLHDLKHNYSINPETLPRIDTDMFYVATRYWIKCIQRLAKALKEKGVK